MAEELKPNMIIHIDWVEKFKAYDVTDQEENDIIIALYRNYVYGTEPSFPDRTIKGIYMEMRARVSEDAKAYISAVETRRQNGAKGGRPKTEKNLKNHSVISVNSGLTEKNLKNPNISISRNISINPKCSVEVEDIPTHTRVAVHSYFQENGISDPDLFISYNLNKGKDYIFDLESEWQAYAQKWKQAERSPGNGEDWEEVKRKFLAGEYDD